YYGGVIGGNQEQHFMAALDIDPNDWTARYYLRQIALQRTSLFIRWEQFEEAREYLGGVLGYVPGALDLELLMGDVCYELGDRAGAAEHYRRHVALGGADPRAVERSGGVEAGGAGPDQ
ncbi:MAG: hypothetical protein JXR94_24870, partial [Candidatus Hydrogenedentes bacterium]|nr:hypothetical protein [Candidatus Hydrogenedentota bacterium]